HPLQGVNRVGPKVRRIIRHSLVEVAAVIGGHRWLAVGIDGLHQEKLDLGVDVAAKTVLSHLRQLGAQYVAWVRPRGLPIAHRDVAEQAGGEVAVLLPTEGQYLESRRVRLASVSASKAREKPSIAEPSKPMPSANAPSSSAGATATD